MILTSMRRFIISSRQFRSLSASYTPNLFKNNLQPCFRKYVSCAIKKSSNSLVKLPLLSDVESYVESDFSLTDLQKEYDEETLPAMITTASLLENCETFDDVYEVLKTAVHGGRLWKDELLLYYVAFLQKYNLLRKDEDTEKYYSANQLLLDNPYFQFLLKETLNHAARLTSIQLSNIFARLVYLHVPPESNTMSLFVSILQDRINEFFPADVMTCIKAIKYVEHHQLKHVDSLRKGLHLHLENQAIDESDFVCVLSATALIEQLHLFTYFQSFCSRTLYYVMINSIAETVGRRPRLEKVKNMKEAENLIHASFFMKYSPGKKSFLLKVATDHFAENREMVTDVQRTLIQRAFRFSELPFSLPNILLAPSEKMIQRQDDYDHEITMKLAEDLLRSKRGN